MNLNENHHDVFTIKFNLMDFEHKTTYLAERGR